ncbi:MAG: response regulator [Deltaproteobacteria bacterium]|nr:MAG: response regulator [Deltaproteobacteria bacterium]
MSKGTILFVDDEANVLNALRRTLRKEPYEIFLAQSAEEAFDILRENDIDLVVSDHLMPSMDGLTFLKKVRELYPSVIRVILTGHADLQMAIEAINEGEVFRFLTKPWMDVELKMTLKHIFDYIDLRRENQVLLDTLRKQQKFIEKMEQEHPGIFSVQRDERGFIVIDEDELLES